jgi:hypothetical protein
MATPKPIAGYLATQDIKKYANMIPVTDQAGDMQSMAAELLELYAERDRLLSAIRWALGIDGDFPERQEGQGLFWWRRELLERAGLLYGSNR